MLFCLFLMLLHFLMFYCYNGWLISFHFYFLYRILSSILAFLYLALCLIAVMHFNRQPFESALECLCLCAFALTLLYIVPVKII